MGSKLLNFLFSFVDIFLFILILFLYHVLFVLFFFLDAFWIILEYKTLLGSGEAENDRDHPEPYGSSLF